MKSSYPACMAVRAAAEQGGDGGYAYLRALREGITCFARKLDAPEALLSEARDAGLDVESFRIEPSASNAVVEAFGADLQEARDVPEEARDAGEVALLAPGRPGAGDLPDLPVRGRGRRGALALRPPGRGGAARGRAGGRAPALPATPRPGVAEALSRFGRMAAPEVAAVCDLAPLKAEAELFGLALEWRARPVAVLAGRLWEAA